MDSRFTEELLQRIDLVALIGDRVSLKKSGSHFSACCPFHHEKTPSFHVFHRDAKPHYHCFGCGAHGDAITFLRELDGLSFMEAVKQLAAQAGMEVPENPERKGREDPRKPLFEASERCATFYRQQLQGLPSEHSLHAYLQRRGLTKEMQDLYGLGYAPDSRQTLTQHPDSAWRSQLETLQLIRTGEDGSRYDLFANRLMFPIRDRQGRYLAFGGRALAEARAKYLNSPEQPLFSKSQVLYGLYETRRTFRKLEQLVVVEGYMDVISLTAAGIPGAVAMMGTATNEESLKRLFQESQNLVFCFDGDAAGLAAADRAAQNLLAVFPAGAQARFAILPAGEDPDSLVRQQGAQALQAHLDEAMPFSSFFFQGLQRDLDLNLPEHRLIANRRATELLEPYRAHPLYPALKDAAWKLKLPPRAGTAKNASVSAEVTGSSSASWRPMARALAGLCLVQVERVPEVTRVLSDMDQCPEPMDTLREALTQLMPADFSPGAWLAALCSQGESAQRFANFLDAAARTDTILTEGLGALSLLQRRSLEQRQKMLIQELENQGDNPDLVEEYRLNTQKLRAFAQGAKVD